MLKILTSHAVIFGILSNTPCFIPFPTRAFAKNLTVKEASLNQDMCTKNKDKTAFLIAMDHNAFLSGELICAIYFSYAVCVLTRMTRC